MHGGDLAGKPQSHETYLDHFASFFVKDPHPIGPESGLTTTPLKYNWTCFKGFTKHGLYFPADHIEEDLMFNVQELWELIFQFVHVAHGDPIPIYAKGPAMENEVFNHLAKLSPPHALLTSTENCFVVQDIQRQFKNPAFDWKSVNKDPELLCATHRVLCQDYG